MNGMGCPTNRTVFSIICGVLLLLTLTWPMQAQVLSDDDLYDRARVAGDRKDYAAARMYIYAFMQRNADEMQSNSALREQVQQFYKWASDETVKVVNEKKRLEGELRNCQGKLSNCTGVSSISQGLTVEIPPPPLDIKPKKQSTMRPSYPLMCRGGGQLHFTYTPYSSISDKPQLRIIFERGTAGVNSQTPSPGQCSWFDRAISSGEPNRLVFATPVFEGRQFTIQWQGGTVMGISSDLPYINALRQETGLRIFHAYNDGKGNLIVTKIE